MYCLYMHTYIHRERASERERERERERESKQASAHAPLPQKDTAKELVDTHGTMKSAWPGLCGARSASLPAGASQSF